jgi:hypothetical protein
MDTSRRENALAKRAVQQQKIIAMPLWKRGLTVLGLTALGALGAYVMSTLLGGPSFGSVAGPAFGVFLAIAWQYFVAPRKWQAEMQSSG